jgi:hypothetical protein
MIRFTAYCMSDEHDGFTNTFQAECLPRTDDELSMYKDDFALEMHIVGVTWTCADRTLIPTVHLKRMAGCTRDDFLAFGWKEDK